MARVYLDSCVVIYLHEGTAGQIERLRTRLRRAGDERPVLCFSDLTRLECRVRPVRDEDESLLADYDDFFALAGLVKLPMTTEIFDHATELRARYQLRTPDALHVATAIEHGCDQFWTND